MGYAARGVRMGCPHLPIRAKSSKLSQSQKLNQTKSKARSRSRSNRNSETNVKSLFRGLRPLVLRASPCAPQPATTTLAPAAPPPPGAIGVVLAVARVGLRIAFHSLRSLQRRLRRLGASRRASRLGNPFFHALHLWKAHPPLRVGCGLATLNLLNFASQSFEPQTRFARLPFCFGRKLKKGVAQALRSGRRGFAPQRFRDLSSFIFSAKKLARSALSIIGSPRHYARASWVPAFGLTPASPAPQYSRRYASSLTIRACYAICAYLFRLRRHQTPCLPKISRVVTLHVYQRKFHKEKQNGRLAEH